jgi:hypothetical protein
MMRTSLFFRDLGILGFGAAVAAVAGVLAGTAMQPLLRDPGDVHGPQIQIADSARGMVTNAANASAYPNGYPDYVVGTDSLAPPEGLEATHAPPSDSEDATFAVEAEAPNLDLALADWRDEGLDPAFGFTVHDRDLPAAPSLAEADAIGG